MEREPRGLLQRHIARGEGVGVAEAEQQENISGPGSDAFDADERPMRVHRRQQRERGKVEPLFAYRLGRRPDRPHLGPGEPASQQRRLFGGQHGRCRERRQLRL